MKTEKNQNKRNQQQAEQQNREQQKQRHNPFKEASRSHKKSTTDFKEDIELEQERKEAMTERD